MNIFIIGPTHSGKTTLAHKLSQTFDLPVLSASEWLKRAIPGANTDCHPSLNRAEILTQTTCNYLKKSYSEDNHKSYDYLKALIEQKSFSIPVNKGKLPITLPKHVIVEGIRNPIDFAHLWNPVKDIVFLMLDFRYNHFELHNCANHVEQEGLNAIYKTIQFWKQVNTFPKVSREITDLPQVYELEAFSAYNNKMQGFTYQERLNAHWNFFNQAIQSVLSENEEEIP